MLANQPTHEVTNQAPPLAPYNVFDADLALREALEREHGGWGVDRLRDTGELAGSVEALEHSERAERNEPRAAQPRPLRPPHRRGGARPVLALAAAPGDRARDPLAAVARAGARGARGASGADVHLVAGERRRDVPGLDDLLGDPRAARRARAGRRVGAAPDPRQLRGRRAGRDGHDREAGRLGRARQQHARRARRRRRLRDHRAQVVLLLSARATSSSRSPRRPAGCPAS